MDPKWSGIVRGLYPGGLMFLMGRSQRETRGGGGLLDGGSRQSSLSYHPLSVNFDNHI